MLGLKSLTRLATVRQYQDASCLMKTHGSPLQMLQTLQLRGRYLDFTRTASFCTTRPTQGSFSEKSFRGDGFGILKPKPHLHITYGSVSKSTLAGSPNSKQAIREKKSKRKLQTAPTVDPDHERELNPWHDPGLVHSTNYSDTLVCLFEFLLLQEIRKEFHRFEVSRTDFIKALLDPVISSHLDNHFQNADNLEIKKLSANSIVRFLKTKLAPTGYPLYALVTIREAFATSLHIEHNPDEKWSMLKESPLDTYDPEDEYVMAERNVVPDPTAPTLNSLMQHLVLLLTGYSSIPKDPSSVDFDMNINLFTFVRERKEEYWHNQSYPGVLATAMESYLKRREGLVGDKSIRGGWYPYPDYDHVDIW
ncbi:hypothetical protein TWF173_008309 [Orbilia oligospora]|nr:hypothetical protein TWF173_008309 [Orbilia oligospora]